MQPARPLATIALALICAAAIPASAQVADVAAVLAQDLANVRASGKVMAALWTARKDYYTLQLVFPLSTPVMPGWLQPARNQVSSATPQPQTASVQVWLLKADGTQIFQEHGSPTPRPEGLTSPRAISYSINYVFPFAASREAIAIAVKINDDFYIDQLKPLR
ncbi:MAG: hypothetical protein ABI645_01625 [Pseudomonadota bacterium]